MVIATDGGHYDKDENREIREVRKDGEEKIPLIIGIHCSVSYLDQAVCLWVSTIKSR